VEGTGGQHLSAIRFAQMLGWKKHPGIELLFVGALGNGMAELAEAGYLDYRELPVAEFAS